MKRAFRDSSSEASGTEIYQRLLGPLESSRTSVLAGLNKRRRADMGQFFTPARTAMLMAEMFENRGDELRLLDAGAGIGTLTAAWVAALCARPGPHACRVSLTAYEAEPLFVDQLEATLAACAEELARADIEATWKVNRADFVEASVESMRDSLFRRHAPNFTSAILNPPYRKIQSHSHWRKLLSSVGIETSNLYTAFLALAVRLLGPAGELVAISPRSFCNGPYFKPFRKLFLNQMALRKIHVFESRDRAFRDYDVLQENIIFHAVKDKDCTSKVLVSASNSPEDQQIVTREIDQSEVVRPDDPDAFIRIVPDHAGDEVAVRMERLVTPLAGLRLSVSTGRVVDFRAKSFLRAKPSDRTVPLIYPIHFCRGFIKWPCGKSNRKPEAIVACAKTEDVLIPKGWYVLVKRFSAKEEKRRIAAAVFDPKQVEHVKLGFENHLNYYHNNGRGMTEQLAKGLAMFLNSTLVDSYFRQFSGHTQVNAADLRRLPYPSMDALEKLGRRMEGAFPTETEIDQLVEDELLKHPEAEDC
ncbi:MAG: Eco57I restriction-modification methylase domain-containing protein [Candidatus Binatus sp.]|jgi:adenine-specific DNA-methyltransferase